MANASNQYATSTGSVFMAGVVDQSAEKLRTDDKQRPAGPVRQEGGPNGDR